MARKKTHSGNQRKMSHESKEKAAQNGSLKANEESTKKAESAGISFFLLAFIFVAITSVAVTYLSEDIKDIFGTFTTNHLPDKETSQNQKDSAEILSDITGSQKLSAEDAVKHKLVEEETFIKQAASSTFQNKEIPTNPQETQAGDKQHTNLDTETENKLRENVKDIDKKSKMSDEESKTDGEAKNSKNKIAEEKDFEKEKINSKDGRDKNLDDRKEKQKTKRKEYSKYNITNTADYKIRKKLDEADKLLEENRVQEAMRKYDEILKTYPDSPRALWGRGQVYDKQAEQQRSNELLEEGIAIMNKALRLPKVPGELLMMIGKKLADRQQFRGWGTKAASTWQYMVEKFPENFELQRQWGVSYLMLGQNEKAREVFQQILKENPDDGFALVHLGFIIKVIDNNPQDGVQLLQAGIDSNAPGTSVGKFFFHLGDGYCRLNQTDKAIKVYKLGAQKGLFLSEYQRSLYNVDTLTGRPWWKAEQTPYQTHLKLLEKNWKTIREEGMAQLDQRTGSFLPEEENLRETGDWKQFTLYSRGRKHEENCMKTPQTCALLDQIPDAKGCKRGQIKYSVMHPGVHVWPHCGPTNCRIRAHLGLVVPEGPRIRVVNDTRTWKEGKFIIFDDSFEHEVWHDGTELRLVLIVDFWHPELTAQQKRSLLPI